MEQNLLLWLIGAFAIGALLGWLSETLFFRHRRQTPDEERARLESELNQAKESLAGSLARIKSLKKDNFEFTAKIESLKGDKSNLQDELSTFKNLRSQLEKDLKKCEADLKKCKAEETGLKKQIADLKTQLGKADQEDLLADVATFSAGALLGWLLDTLFFWRRRQTGDEKRAQLESELTQAQDNLKNERAVRKRENDEFTAKIKSLEGEKVGLEKQIAALNAQLGKADQEDLVADVATFSAGALLGWLLDTLFFWRRRQTGDEDSARLESQLKQAQDDLVKVRADLKSLQTHIKNVDADGADFSVGAAVATLQWHAANDAYLSAALAWLRLRLELEANEKDVTARAVQQAADALLALEAGPERPALLRLTEQFGLTRFEQQVLLLCAGLELHTQIGRLCGVIQDNPELGFPTFALAMALFEKPSWDIVSPEASLLRWHLIDVQKSTAQPVFLSPLRADMRIVHFLKGINSLDARLAALLAPLETFVPREPLADSQEQVVADIVRIVTLLDQQTDAGLPILQLLGIDQASKQQVALDVCDLLHLTLFRLPVERLAAHADQVDLLARLWQRETRLLRAALYVDMESVPEEIAPTAQAAVRQFLDGVDGVCFLGTRDVGFAQDRPTATFDIGKPTAVEQRQEWEKLLDARAADIPARLAGQFNLGLPAIRATHRQVDADNGADKLADRLWDACLATTRPQLDSLAQRLDPKAEWDDIVLPEEAKTLMRAIVDQVRLRSQVYDEGGFRQRMNRGLGISALFAGPSGTGKTMAAEVLANELRLNLYRIDLSSVVSKYIGETEKNLRRLFDAAEDGGALLFFDEADALFGKRSEVKDSHDRYANIEVNYLLQRIESYQGLAILATNRKEALDSAFLRRLRFMLDFPVPSEADRVLMWHKVFPQKTKVAGLDYQRLGRFNLTGGNIHSIALNAAFLAARDGDGAPVTMEHVLAAARIEHRKLDRPIQDAAFRWEVTARQEG